MNRNMDIMDQVKRYAEEFMERTYPDEAPFFPIAWDVFKEALQDNKNVDLGLKGPTVRDPEESPFELKGDDTIMAPMVIRAFHILFTMMQRMESENSGALKDIMLQLLLQNKFFLDFSMEIVDFFMEKMTSEVWVKG